MPPATRKAKSAAAGSKSKLPAPTSSSSISLVQLGVSQSSLPVPASKTKLSLPAAKKRRDSLTNAAKIIPSDLVSPVKLKFGGGQKNPSKGKHVISY